ncbi:hypothetical protein IWW36_002691 [Coemansia brasiliensis]|uniref:Uncharacterized protein n=1 Tax=Coemansia brasiliensis TaxID=2650707 RepID=A0A9W8LZ82_9FUNG|nr:hypothetical protein IWW36_002691 [Coemansia brasiliensis]
MDAQLESASALADKLPQPPIAVCQSAGSFASLAPNSSTRVLAPNGIKHNSSGFHKAPSGYRVPVAITTIAEVNEDAMHAQLLSPHIAPSESDDLAAERPPSALFQIDTVLPKSTQQLLTPPPKRHTRRNTFGGVWPVEDTQIDEQPSTSLLENEMPPSSPLFASVPQRDLVDYNQSMQQLRRTRRRTMESYSACDQAMLEDEMPPPSSPFFADIPANDLALYHQSMRRLRSARRNTPGAQRATWCSPPTDYSSGSTHRPATTLPRPSLTGMLNMWSQNTPWDSPSKQLGEAACLVPRSDSEDDEDWLLHQQPPQSPLFADYHSERATKRQRAHLSAPPPDCSALQSAISGASKSESYDRWFQVDVHSLFASPFESPSQPKVTVREVAIDQANASSLIVVDADDPDVLPALKRYLTLLSLKKNPAGVSSSRRPTSIRVPSQSKLPPEIIDFHTPALSFMVRSKSQLKEGLGPRDARVRAVDLEAMVEAYLPHVYAELNPLAPQRPARSSSMLTDPGSEMARSPSESSVATLADSASSAQPAYRQQPKRPSISSQSSDLRISAPLLRKASSAAKTPQLEDPAPIGRGLRPSLRPLRASVSVMNLRGNSSSAQLGLSQPALSERRRSTPRAVSQTHSSRPAFSAAIASASASAVLARRRSEASAAALPRRRSEAVPASPPSGGIFGSANRNQRPTRMSLSQVEQQHSAPSYAGGNSRSRLASPRLSMLSVSSSRSSMATTDTGSAEGSLLHRRRSVKSTGSYISSSSQLPGTSSTSRPRYPDSSQPVTPTGSLRNRKDMAPLTLMPMRRGNSNISSTTSSTTSSNKMVVPDYRYPVSANPRISGSFGSSSGVSASSRVSVSGSRPTRTSSSSVPSGNRMAGPRTSSAMPSLASAQNSNQHRRRGISTGSHQPTSQQPKLVPDYLRLPIPNNISPSRPQISGRRPDIRQVFAQDTDDQPKYLRRTTIAHNRQSLPANNERSAVRQRIGAKLSEFRSKLFSP